MEYRFDPYTGQPLNATRPASSRTWLSGVPQTPPTPPPQPPARQEQPGVIFRQVASLDEAKAVPTDFSGALTIIPVSGTAGAGSITTTVALLRKTTAGLGWKAATGTTGRRIEARRAATP